MVSAVSLLQTAEPNKTAGTRTGAQQDRKPSFVVGFEELTASFTSAKEKESLEISSTKPDLSSGDVTEREENKLPHDAHQALTGKTLGMITSGKVTSGVAKNTSALSLLRMVSGASPDAGNMKDVKAGENTETVAGDREMPDPPVEVNGKESESVPAPAMNTALTAATKAIESQRDLTLTAETKEQGAKFQSASALKNGDKKKEKAALNDVASTAPMQGVTTSTANSGTAILNPESIKSEPMPDAPGSDSREVRVASELRRKTSAVAAINVQNGKQTEPTVAMPIAGAEIADKTRGVDEVRSTMHEAASAIVAEMPLTKLQDGIASAGMATEVKLAPADPASGMKIHANECAVGPADASVSTTQGEIDMPGTSWEGHRMLTATPTSLEVGVANGTHGWLKIRAEINDGAVTASLSTASTSGQTMLHRELPALTTFLEHEQLAVKTVVVDRVVNEPGMTGGANNNSSGEGRNGQSRGQLLQNNLSQDDEAQRQSRRQNSPYVWGRAEQPRPYQDWIGDRMAGMLSMTGYTAGGSWLSVRA